MTATPPASIDFRPDLNGLRAVAILVVLLFHFNIGPFTGGFAGVDVFFVLSGFLMTQIIVRGLDKGSFGLPRFYLNRVARIFPALAVLGAACLGLGYYLLPTDQYTLLAVEAGKALTFSVNFLYASDTGYFSPAAAERWFLHCWSLAVEFQFYILFPLYLYVAKLLHRRRGIVGALLLAIVTSLVCSYWQTAQHAVCAFYLLPSRVWEFAAGGLMLFMPTVPPRWRSALAALGLMFVLAAVFCFTSALAYPSLWATIPVLGAATVIWARSSFVGLTNPVSQFIGTISYSLYLWHWPILTIGHYFGYGERPEHTVVLLLLTVAAAWLSFRFIETPFRDMFRSWSPYRLVPAAIVTILLGTGCAHIIKTQGAPARLSDKMFNIAQQSVYHGEFRDGTCFLRPEQAYTDLTPNCLDPEPGVKKPTLVIWGSSHAAHLYGGIARQAWASQYKIIQLTASACEPMPRDVNPLRPHCGAIQLAIRKFIASAKPDILLVVMPTTEISDAAAATVPDTVMTREGLQQQIGSLRHDGVGRVLVVGPGPDWNTPLPRLFFREHLLHPHAADSRLKLWNTPWLTHVDQQYRDALAPTGATYLSMLQLMCNGDGCRTLVPDSASDVLFYFDQNHLTGDGSAWVAEHLIGPALGNAPAPKAFVANGQLLTFNDKSPAVQYLTGGWMPPEGWGTWTAAPQRAGILNLPVDAAHPPSAVKLKFWGVVAPSMPVEHFTISIDGQAPLQTSVRMGDQIVEQVIPLAAGARQAAAARGRLRMEFHAPDGKSSKELGINDDLRVLGFGIRELTLLP